MTDVNEQKRSPDVAASSVAHPVGRRRTMTVADLALLAVLVTSIIFVAVELGPALLGFKVFGGVDLLRTWRPWSTGETLTGPSAIPYVTDNLDYVFPGYVELHQRLFTGDLPLFSGFSGAGNPLMALPNLPTLTPSSIWLLLLPTSWSLGLSKLVEVVLGFGGMMLWLRRLGTTWAAGGIGGLLYVGSGFVVAWADWTGQASAACLIPAVFWSVERLVAMRTVRSALPLSAVVAFLLLSGFPAVAGHALYAGGIYFVVRLVGTRSRYQLRATVGTFALGVAAVLVGAGVSAVQLLPSLRVLQDTDLSYRTAQFAVEQPVTSFLSVVFPRVFNKFGYLPSNPIEAYSFVGFAAVALALVALLAGRSGVVPRGVVWMLAITAALSASIVWYHGFWTDWLQNVPIFNGNNSGRLRDLVALGACALAGIGADSLFRGKMPAAVRRRFVLACWTTVVIGAAGAVVVGIHYSAVISRALLVQDAALGLGTVAVLGVSFALARPGAADRLRQRLLSGAVVLAVALIGLQAGTSVAYFWPTSDPDNFYPETAAITAAQAQVQSQRAVNLQSFPGNSGESYGIRTVTGHTFQPDTWKDLLNSIDPKAFTGPNSSPTNPALSVPLTSTRLSTDGKLLDRMAANTIVAAPGLDLPGRLLLPTTEPPAATSPFGTGRLSMATGTAAGIPLTPQNLRGVQVRLLDAVPASSSSVSFTATITDAGGAVLATGRTTRGRYAAGPVQIPVAGEHLATAHDPLRLSVGISQPDGPARFLALAGTGGVPGVLVIGSQPDGLTETFADNTATIWSRSTALPRVRWAQAAAVVPDPGKRLAMLADPSTPDSTVVLSAPGPQPSGQDASVTVDTDDGDQVTADVDAKGPGYLVLADAIQTGWRVQVNGGGAAIVAADHAFGAVFVQTGHSVVSFSYVGKGLKSGAVITAVSLVVLAGVLVATFVLGRRRRLLRERGRPA